MLHLCEFTKVGTALGIVATMAVATNDPCYTGIATSHNKFYFIFSITYLYIITKEHLQIHPYIYVLREDFDSILSHDSSYRYQPRLLENQLLYIRG